MGRNKSLVWGLFCLRLGLGIYMSIQALALLLLPEANSVFFVSFFDLHLRASFVMLLGGIGLAVSLLFVLGLAKTYTYGFLSISSLTLLVLGATSLNMHEQTDYQSILNLLPVVFSSLALFIMRDFDTKLILGKKKSLFS